MEAGKSYWIEPNGKTHDVPSCYHHTFAGQYLRDNHQDIIEQWNNMNPEHRIRDFIDSDHNCKDLLVGQLHWITFTPLGTNTHVGDIGRNVEGKHYQVRFTRHQINTLIQLLEVNSNSITMLEKILKQNGLVE